VDNEESQLLEKIAAAPWTHAPRLEYAAWLERQTNTLQSDQAQFLRLDVEHEQIEEMKPESGGLDSSYYDRLSQVRCRLQELRRSLDPAWLAGVDRDLAIPPELSPRGKVAAQVIVQFLLAEGLTRPGGRAFRSPEDWKEYGEFGHDYLLVLVHDGGAIQSCVSREWGEQELIDRFENHLLRHGFVRKLCMAWYSAIYNLIEFKPFRVEIRSG
jgi:uncharacterized protein (TIGR02996 family)